MPWWQRHQRRENFSDAENFHEGMEEWECRRFARACRALRSVRMCWALLGPWCAAKRRGGGGLSDQEIRDLSAEQKY